jgi:protoporphyrinogen/coproporphyrinogen III oxidase
MSAPTVVVGAGLSGLAAAWTLSNAGAEVLLLEGSDRPGGVVRSEKKEGFLLETGPNTVRPTPELSSLIEALGLDGEVLRADPRAKRYVDFEGALHAVPMSPGQLLSTQLLSAGAKLRLLGEPFRRAAPVPDESVRDFVARRLGPEVADRLVEPFVAGIFSGNAAKISVSAAFPILSRAERDHGSLFGAILASARSKKRSGPAAPRGLLSFRDGLETLSRALASRLSGRFRASTAVQSLSPRADGWTVRTGAGDLDADRVVLAIPAPRAAELVAGFAPEAAAALAGIPHPPVVVLHMDWPESALARPLDGFGHLVCNGPGRRILGAVWSSSLFPGRAPAGQALMTIFMGGARDPGAIKLSDNELTELAARDVASEGLVRGAGRAVLVTRWRHAIPQYERGHEERIAELARAEARWPGLRFLGNYRGGVSVGDVVRSGIETGLSLSRPRP